MQQKYITRTMKQNCNDQTLYLPISQENNGLDDDELWDGIKWLEQIPTCNVKQVQSIQRSGVRKCIDNCEIKV